MKETVRSMKELRVCRGMERKSRKSRENLDIEGQEVASRSVFWNPTFDEGECNPLS